MKARFNADTGSGGLLNTGSTAYVRDFMREGHYDARQVKPWPSVAVAIKSRELGMPSVGRISDAFDDYEGFDAVVRFRIEVDRDREFPATAGTSVIDRVESRIRDRFNNQTLTAFADTDDSGRTWSFAPMGRVEPGPDHTRQSPTGKTMIRDVAYRVIATKGVTGVS